MRKIYLLFLMLLIAFTSFGQTSGTIQIGQGNASLAIVNDDYLPISSNWGANYTQQIILREEFLHQGAPGNITKIKWYVKERPSSISSFNQWKVYIGYTPNNNFTSTQFISPSSNQLVWEGTITESQMVAGSWMELTLTTPFNYNGTSNLIVSVYENAPSYTSGLTFAKYKSPFLNQGMYRRNDTQSNVSNPPTSSQTGTYVANNIAYIQFEGNLNTCNSPYNVSVSNVLPTTATLNWNVVNPAPTGGFEYEIRTDTNPGVPGANLAVSGTSLPGSLTVDVSGFSPNTFYYVYVRVSCGAVWSSWSVPIFFTSLCTPQTVPYIMPLPATSGTALPECVSVQNSNGDAITWVTAAAQTGITGRVMSLSASSTLASNDWFYTKGLNLSANQVYKLSFKYKKGTAATTQKLKVMYGSTPFQDGMTNLITDHSISESSTTASPLSEYYFEPTTSGVYYLGFNGYAAASQGTLYVGEISVDLGPSCVIPVNVNITSVTKNSATINWEAPVVLPTNGYEYEIRTEGLPSSGSVGLVQSGTVTSSELFKNITGLTPSTEYKVYLRSGCSATSSSAWTVVKSFTTLCNYPDLISAPAVTRCGTGIVNLTASYSNNELVRWFSAETGGVPLHTGVNYSPTVSDPSTSFYVSAGNLVPDVNAKIVDGNLTTNSWGNNPFYSNYGGVKTQYIFKADELINSGLAAGNLTSLSFELNTVSSPYTGRNNFSISIGQTETASLSSGFVMDVTKVYPNQETAYTLIIDEASDIQNLVFNQPFYWDGQKNIVVQIVWNNGNSSGASNVTVKSSAAPAGLTRFSAVDDLSNTQVLLNLTTGVVTGAGYTNSGTPAYRPNIYFNGTGICASPRTEVVATVTSPPVFSLSETEFEFCEGESALVTVIEGAANYDSYVWEPATGVTGDATIGWTFTPVESTVYTLTASQSAGAQCSSVINVNVDVDPLPLMLDLGTELQSCAGEILELKIGDDTVWPSNYFNSFETTTLEGFVQGGTGVTATTTPLVSSVGSRSLNLVTVSDAIGFVTLNNSLDLSDFSTPYLTFDHIAAMEGYGDYSYDFGYVEYSLNGGVTWILFKPSNYVGAAAVLDSSESIGQRFSTRSYLDWKNVITGSTVDPTNALWKTERFNFPTGVDLSNVKIRFKATSDGSSNYKGWFIDNVNIKEAPLTTATWLPDTNLYTDSLATIPYVEGVNAAIVYFKSNTAMSATDYTVTVVSIAGCEVQQTVEITNVLVSAPIVENQSFCTVTNVEDILVSGIVTGGVVKWYATEEGNVEITSVSTSGTYFVEQEINGCSSSRVSVEINVIGIDVPPVVQVSQSLCGAPTVADLIATPLPGNTIGWFDSLTSVEPLALDVELVGASYYVAQFNGICWSPKVSVLVSITEKPSAPNVVPQNFCGDHTLADIDLGDAGDATLNWYSTATSLNVLPLSTVAVTGTYYVSKTMNGCESERVAIPVVSQSGLPAPIAPVTQFFCGQTLVSQLQATASVGGTIGWFDSLTSESPLNGSQSVNSGIYFVSQFNGACWSTRVQVQVTVNAIPLAPNNSQVQLCGIYTFGQVSLGQSANAILKWYLNSTTTTVIPSGTTVVTGAYYVSQTVSGCESPRVLVNVTQTDALAAPSASAQSFCGFATVADLAVVTSNGAEVRWYASANASNPLPSNTQLATGTYYVVQYKNGCESNRVGVSVFVSSINAPLVNPFNFCGSATVADLYIPTATGVVYKWYNSPTNTTALASNSALQTGNYFVSRTQNGCESSRTAVQVTIHSLPSAPTGVSPQTFIEGSTLNDVIMNQQNVTWYITYSDSQTGTNPLSPLLPLVNGTTYYGVVIGTNGCPSLPFAMTVNVYLSTDEFVKNDLKYYPNPVVDILNISYSERILQIEVFDLLGKRIKVKSTNDINVSIDLSDLSVGTYMVQLKTDNKTQFLKIVKK